MNNAGNRLVAALSVPRYRNVKRINLEFASDVEDKHLEIIKSKGRNSLGNLEVLNLNGCKKISDNGIEFITYACPKLKAFSIYWNVRVTDLGIKYLVKNCKHVIDLNLSGCKARILGLQLRKKSLEEENDQLTKREVTSFHQKRKKLSVTF